MRNIFGSLLLLSALGCSADDKGDAVVTDSGAVTGEGEGEGEGEGGDSGLSSEPTIAAHRMVATGTWTLTFDEDAEAAGFTDCSYTREYAGLQALDLDYLCPECEIITSGVSTMTDGADCYTAVFGEENSGDRVEMWGIDVDGAQFYRSGRENGALGALSEITPAEDTPITATWESDYTMTAGGGMVLSATATITYTVDEDTLLTDPWAERTTDYACGWPRNNPGDLVLDYTLAEGSTFPDVRLEDQCGDQLELWDLYGHYLILDTSQPDCGPCRSMASTSEAFAAQMEEEGIPVMVVSFLGGGLSEPWATPPEETFDSWVTDYGITDPVLYDRGFGYAMFPAFTESFTGEDFGYPTWLVVDPDMNLMYANVGFGSWDSVAEILRADWESR